MYSRMITAHVHTDQLDTFVTRFSDVLLPEISREAGFKGIYVMKDAALSQFVAVVFWETEADAVASIDHFLRERLPKMADLLVNRPEARTMEVVLRA